MARPKETKYCETDQIGKQLKARFGPIGTQKSFLGAYEWITQVNSGTRRPNEAPALLDDLQKHFDAGNKEFFLALAYMAEGNKTDPPQKGRLIGTRRFEVKDPLRYYLRIAFFDWGSIQKWMPTFSQLMQVVDDAGWQADKRTIKRIVEDLGVLLKRGTPGRPRKT